MGNLIIESGLRVVIGIPFLSQWWCGGSSRDISTAPLSFGYICEESYLSIHDPKSSAISSFGFEYRICIDDLQGGLVLRSAQIGYTVGLD